MNTAVLYSDKNFSQKWGFSLSILGRMTFSKNTLLLSFRQHFQEIGSKFRLKFFFWNIV